ncbi:MAG: hypothetical protein LBS03_04390 [Bacteroidales bacterium]|jgi:hypothetical protein|nr:hypothetical protein [Bacteroidales bacterium]
MHKHILFLFSVLAVALGLFSGSCRNETTTPDFIDPVSAVRLIPDTMAVIATWRNPSSPILDYVEVSYTDEDGQPQVLQQREFVGDPASGLSTAYLRLKVKDAVAYEFTLTAVSNTGLRSEPVKASATAIADVYKVLLNSIRVYQPAENAGVIRVEFDNSLRGEFPLFVSVEYPSGGTMQTVVFPAESAECYLPAGVDMSPLPEVTVWTHDEHGGESARESRATREEFLLAPSAFTLLDQTPAWFAGVNATRLFDGNVFGEPWHTAATSTPPYPHFVLVQLDEVYELTKYALYPRTSEAAARSDYTIRLLVSLENATEGGEEWTDTGTFDFMPGGLEPYYTAANETPPRELAWFVYPLFMYPLAEYPHAQYFRLEILTNANNPYSYLNEVRVYALR